MKKFVFLMAMLFVIAGLIASVSKALPQVDSRNTQDRYPTRDVFYTEDFEAGALGWTHFDGAVTPNNWHIYNNADAQGDVWWMGDPANGGYHDHQYLVLNTSQIPISTGNSTLTFKMRHGLEAPGASGGYDGWDSFNIRISTNNGLSYSVIPGAITSPTYDFANSYAFGSEFGEGLGVPGWGGMRTAWTTVTVDLSGYLVSGTANVNIRFAFASDPAYNTDDDPTMFGVMIDDVSLAGYSNNGVSAGMTYSSLVPTAGDFWHLATDASAPSPTHIMSSMNNAGTYVPFMLNYVESPSIPLPAAATQIVADFQLKGSFTDTGTFPDVDYFGWEVYHTGSWHYMSNPYDDPEGNNYVYSSAPDLWASMINSYTLDGDITLLAGQTVKFRWYFQSNDTVSGTPLQIDDFQIFSVSAAPAPVNLVYPANNQEDMPYTGFELDWSPSSLGAQPQSYAVYLDSDLANLEEATFNPTYSLSIVPVYNPADSLYYLYSYCHTDDIPDFTMAAGQTWYWTVVASVPDQADAYSDIFRFDTVLASQVITTFPWNEGFEAATFPPTGWTIANVDNDATTWVVNTTATYNHGGTKSAKHVYATSTPEPGQNGWLISPPIQLPSTGIPAVWFWNYNLYGGEVVNGLMINTDPNPTDPNWVQLWNQDEIAGHWSQEVVSLAPYVGNIVYLAFKYTGYDANTWYVDDVKVSIHNGDDIAPTLFGHLPVLNTPREDLSWPVSVKAVDDPLFNNAVTGVNLYWSLNAGSTWSAAIPMTLSAGTYAAELPPQNLGSTVTYKFEALDSIGNIGVATYSYEVNDPTWIWYDTGGTGFSGFASYNWGPAVYFENPFYGTNTAVKLLGSDGAVHNNTAGNGPTTALMHVYGEDFAGNLTDLMTPIPVVFTHRVYRTVDLSSYNINITTPWFWITYEDMGTNRYFLFDSTYDYTTPTFLMIGGDLYTSTSVGEWAIGANVQTGGPALYFPPEVTIALNGSGQAVLSWDPLDGALSYDVYGSNDPYAVFPTGWTVLGDNVPASPYTYTGTAPMQFFKVVASTNAGGSKSMTLKPNRSHRNTAANLSVIPSLVKDASFETIEK